MTGRKLGNYLLIEEVGRGGMGAVYKARDLRLNRIVAVKLLTMGGIDDEARRRFLQEARAISAINDPGIVTLHDIGSEDGIDFLVMEFVEGSTLAKLIPPTGLAAATALRYTERIARALAVAHGIGIVHRDLKPGNVIVRPSGELKVLDFGLAKLNTVSDASDETRMAMTQAGSTLGTPSYMSPEQCVGAPVSTRSDIFSLGVMLYEMLAGKRPFSGQNTVALAHAIHYDDPAPIVPPPAEMVYAIVRRALEKKPEMRYASMEAFGADLRQALEELESGITRTRLVSAPPVGVRAKGSRKRMVAGVVLAAVGVAGAGVWVYASRAKVGKSGAEIQVDTGRPAHELVLEARKLIHRADVPANLAKAIAILRAATVTYGDHAASHASLALALTRTNGGNPGAEALEEAKRHADRAVALDGQLALTHVALGSYYCAVRQYGEGERELQEAVKLDPGNGAAHHLLGVVYYRKGNLERAQREYEEAVRLEPEDFEARNGLAAILYHRGDHKGAERESLEAVKLAPDSPQPHQMLGTMYYAQGRMEEAIREYQKALEIQPSARAYSNLGTIYFFRQMYGQSAAAFEKATALQPERYLYWGNLGDAYRWTANGREKANAAYDKAIALTRKEMGRMASDMEARSRLAVWLAKRGEREAAKEEIRRVGESKGEKTGPLHYRMVVAHEVIGERAEALAALGLALQANYSADEIRRDPELAALREDAGFRKLMGKRAVE